MEQEEEEGLNEWEQIQTTASSSSRRTTTGYYDGAAAEISDDYIFPPDHHEGLTLPPEPPPAEEAESAPAEISGEVWRRRVGTLRCGALRFAAAFRSYVLRRGVFWSFGSVGGVLAAAWLWARVRRWGRRSRREDGEGFVVLVRERDQKINQLLVQIAQMNEMLIVRRSVQVIRLGS